MADGVVLTLWRYPVKSMQGEELNAFHLDDRGVLGDRALALVDVETGKVVSAKNPRKWPGLFDFRAVITAPPEPGHPGRRAAPSSRQNSRPNLRRHLLPPCPARPIQQPGNPVGAIAAKPQIHRRPGNPGQRSDLLLRSVLRVPQHDPRPRGHRRRHIRAVHQRQQFGVLIDRQLHSPSQHQDQSSLRKENRITRH
jgi:MOSC N-terminal beta barrel domain